MRRMTINRSVRELLKLFGPALMLMIAGFWLAYQFVDPAPPTRLHTWHRRGTRCVSPVWSALPGFIGT